MMIDMLNIDKFASLVKENLQDRLDTSVIFSKQRILEVIHASIYEIYMEKFRDNGYKISFSEKDSNC